MSQRVKLTEDKKNKELSKELSKVSPHYPALSQKPIFLSISTLIAFIFPAASYL